MSATQDNRAFHRPGRRRRLLFVVWMAGLLSLSLWPVMSADTAGADDDAGDASGPAAELGVSGFVEMEDYVNTYADQDFQDAVKKTELRTRLLLKYGRDRLYLFAASDLYLQPDLVGKGDGDDFDYRYADGPTVGRNLRISGDRYEWDFNELYVNYLIYPLRLRLGNQMFRWGTADVFNPTAYFNPYDFREFLLRDSDEFRQGVPALSAMYFADNLTTELVLSFVHVPMLFAPQGNFWSVEMAYPLYRTSIQQSDGMDTTVENAGVGARMSTNLFNADVSLSVYHGPDREPVQRPYAVSFAANQPFVLEVVQQYEVINMVGLDFSKAVGDFVFQVEGAYSPDKPNFVTQPLDNPAAVRLPFEVRRSNFLSYAAGFNYFVPIDQLFENHTGEMVFTLDWFQSVYLDSELARPFLSDILTLRLQDSYWDGRVDLNLTAMFETHYGGTLFWPKIKYDFQNGWSAELAYAAIDGQLGGEVIEPLFYHFRDNDIVTLRVRYEF